MTNFPLYRTDKGTVAATYKRNLINWVLPDSPVVSMFINPANLSISRNKSIKSDRTKGGFLLQYWGEDLVDVSLSGTTGSFGIEGINLLEDIFRNEQNIFNYYGLNAEAEYEKDQGDMFSDFLMPSLGDALDFVSLFGDSQQNSPFSGPKPTLAYFAASVEMHYGAASYHGYFTSFNITESADTLGWFNYDLKFKATIVSGRRPNFMPWHRSPTLNGQSINSSYDYESSLSYPRTIGYRAVDSYSGSLPNYLLSKTG